MLPTANVDALPVTAFVDTVKTVSIAQVAPNLPSLAQQEEFQAIQRLCEHNSVLRKLAVSMTRLMQSTNS